MRAMDQPAAPLKRRRAKIVATLGPASRDAAVVAGLIRAGANVFRLNLAHGEHADHRTAYERTRAAAAETGEPVAVLADLCGPKLRVGRFARGQVELTPGSRVTVTTRDMPGEAGLIPCQYAALAHDVRPGDRILLDDGLLELRVEAAAGSEVACTVVQGGVLKDRKGMNLPGVAVSAPALTDKDRDDARFALELGVDFLALSFVRAARDVEELKALVAASGQSAEVIAKIEKPEALAALDGILDAADGIMVARGDLGVEMSPEAVPLAQLRLVGAARSRNKPVIVATQMLESMITQPRPTRAEVSDVSTAVFSGADAIMLSGETAVGAHPAEAVRMMDRVARQVEGWQWTHGAFGMLTGPSEVAPPLPLHAAVARATAQLSRDLRVRTIAVISRTGTTGRVVSAARPAAPVLAVTPDPAACRRMILLWGTVPVAAEAAELQQATALARRLGLTLGLAEEGQFILMVTGFRPVAEESEPAVTVLRV
jgi:pyruvate kinase